MDPRRPATVRYGSVLTVGFSRLGSHGSVLTVLVLRFGYHGSVSRAMVRIVLAEQRTLLGKVRQLTPVSLEVCKL